MRLGSLEKESLIGKRTVSRSIMSCLSRREMNDYINLKVETIWQARYPQISVEV